MLGSIILLCKAADPFFSAPTDFQTTKEPAVHILLTCRSMCVHVKRDLVGSQSCFILQLYASPAMSQQKRGRVLLWLLGCDSASSFISAGVEWHRHRHQFAYGKADLGCSWQHTETEFEGHQKLSSSLAVCSIKASLQLFLIDPGF